MIEYIYLNLASLFIKSIHSRFPKCSRYMLFKYELKNPWRIVTILYIVHYTKSTVYTSTLQVLHLQHAWTKNIHKAQQGAVFAVGWSVCMSKEPFKCQHSALKCIKYIVNIIYMCDIYYAWHRCWLYSRSRLNSIDLIYHSNL